MAERPGRAANPTLRRSVVRLVLLAAAGPAAATAALSFIALPWEKLAVISLGFIVVAAAGSTLAVARIMRPLDRLAHDAETVIRGTADASLPVDREDEVGRIARAISTMTADSFEAARALERKLRQEARVLKLQREIASIYQVREGVEADSALLSFLARELELGRSMLGRIEDAGDMRCLFSDSGRQERVAPSTWPASWKDSFARQRACLSPEWEPAEAGGGRSVALLPIAAGGKDMGLLALWGGERPLDDSDLPFLDTVRALLAATFIVQIEKREQDFRKLKIIEEAYQVNEAKVRAIIDESQDMILTSDHEGRIIDINKAGVRLLGLASAEQALGRLQSEFWSNASDHEIFLHQITDAGFIKDFEVIMKRSDGVTLFCLESATLIRSRDGASGEIHAIVKDISERIHDEQALWKMNIELAEANKKLKESQLIMVQQEKLASIGQLAAGVAHEINNPLSFLASNHTAIKRSLATITSFLALVRERGGADIEGERGRRDIDGLLADFDDIMRESDDGYRRITNIVQNLRNFSRIDSSEQFEPTDVNKGIQDTLAVARNEVKYAAEVTTHLAEVPLVECVSGHINQVLLNLIVNAAQAIKSQNRREPGSIAISTGLGDDSVWIEIRDDGPGIQKGHQLRIFDPFFTTKPVGQGTGLGLSISYDIIVNKHGGSLTVESEPGKGACFRIELPIRHAAQKGKTTP